MLFTGRVTDAELVRYLSTADVCLSPDPGNGFNEHHTMNKTMEYMAFELPVVAFDLRETRVSAGEAAVYVTPNDVHAYAEAIVELVDDEQTRSLMGKLGRARVEQELAWSYQERAYLDVYRAQFKATLAVQFQYRVSAVIWLIFTVLEPTVYLVVWSAVARSGRRSCG